MGTVESFDARRRLSKTFDAENAEAIHTGSYLVYNALKNLNSHKTMNHSVGGWARDMHASLVPVLQTLESDLARLHQGARPTI
ncbi:MAG: hypothetical protein O2V44_09535 [Candidatus Bathyarchaeota archaeon]|nr:hypothetical protein [Candidatus Bathyarchaeota archaeon]